MESHELHVKSHACLHAYMYVCTHACTHTHTHTDFLLLAKPADYFEQKKNSIAMFKMFVNIHFRYGIVGIGVACCPNYWDSHSTMKKKKVQFCSSRPNHTVVKQAGIQESRFQITSYYLIREIKHVAEHNHITVQDCMHMIKPWVWINCLHAL